MKACPATALLDRLETACRSGRAEGPCSGSPGAHHGDEVDPGPFAGGLRQRLQRGRRIAWRSAWAARERGRTPRPRPVSGSAPRSRCRSWTAAPAPPRPLRPAERSAPPAYRTPAWRHSGAAPSATGAARGSGGGRSHSFHSIDPLAGRSGPSGPVQDRLGGPRHLQQRGVLPARGHDLQSHRAPIRAEARRNVCRRMTTEVEAQVSEVEYRSPGPSWPCGRFGVTGVSSNGVRAKRDASRWSFSARTAVARSGCPPRTASQASHGSGRSYEVASRRTRPAAAIRSTARLATRSTSSSTAAKPRSADQTADTGNSGRDGSYRPVTARRYASAQEASAASTPADASPVRSGDGSSPAVVLRPSTPHHAAGIHTDPAPSLPVASGTMPVATATADPADNRPRRTVRAPRIAGGAVRAEAPGLPARPGPRHRRRADRDGARGRSRRAAYPRRPDGPFTANGAPARGTPASGGASSPGWSGGGQPCAASGQTSVKALSAGSSRAIRPSACATTAFTGIASSPSIGGRSRPPLQPPVPAVIVQRGPHDRPCDRGREAAAGDVGTVGRPSSTTTATATAGRLAPSAFAQEMNQAYGYRCC